MADPEAFSSPALDVASDTNYDTVGDDYDGTALKATPTTAQIEQGFARPGHQLDAQHLNWLHNQFAAIASTIIGQLQRTPDIQIITTTSASVSIPTWAKTVEFVVKGGGGGGAGITALGRGGGGGGSGYEHRACLPRSAVADTVSVTIGSGGAGGGAEASGFDGGTTTISWSDVVLRAEGGSGAPSDDGGDGYCGGGGGESGDDSGAGGTAGSDGEDGASNSSGGTGIGSVLHAGMSGAGGAGRTWVGDLTGGGGGAGLLIDGAPNGGDGTGSGRPGFGGKGYGAGGGGGTSTGTGGAGAPGVVIITSWGGSDE